MTLIFKINSFSFVAVETKKKENSKVLCLYADPPKTLGQAVYHYKVQTLRSWILKLSFIMSYFIKIALNSTKTVLK